MNESKLNTTNIVGTHNIYNMYIVGIVDKRYNCCFLPISRYVIFNFM